MTSMLDTVGGYQLPIGLAGNPVDGSIYEVDTLINEATTGGLDSAGMIDFANVVAKGTNDNGCTILGGSNLVPVGLSSRRQLRGADVSTNLVGYKTGDALGVYRLGDVICMAAENVTANDEVVALATAYSPSTGISTNVGGATGGVADGSTRIKVARHVWRTTTSQGQLGVVAVYGRDIAPATTS